MIQVTSHKSQVTRIAVLLLFILLSWVVGRGSWVCYAQPVSSSELINNAGQYDGKTVTYAGEVIGDVMRRGNYAWLNVSDGKNAIGIWAPAGLIQDITLAGNYKIKGDTVEVSGEFSRSCPEHGGDLDIHALSLRKDASGSARVEKMDPDKKNQAVILLGVLIAVWILSKFLRR
ncbi:MAG: DNA-binding protein [Candidatus Omnitrophota bacterium]|nr:DNA-binding protein [Candidatus Omnitrophota bacterium]